MVQFEYQLKDDTLRTDTADTIELSMSNYYADCFNEGVKWFAKPSEQNGIVLSMSAYSVNEASSTAEADRGRHNAFCCVRLSVLYIV